jgi:hypothetical protein
MTFHDRSDKADSRIECVVESAGQWSCLEDTSQLGNVLSKGSITINVENHINIKKKGVVIFLSCRQQALMDERQLFRLRFASACDSIRYRI